MNPESKPFEMEYFCQIGEKPGSSTFSFHLLNEKVTVSLNQPLNHAKMIQSSAVLTAHQLEELKTVIMLLPLPTAKPEEPSLAGAFELRANWNDRKQIWRAPSNHAYPYLNKFFEWISKIYQANPQLQVAKPLFPGQSED